MKGLFLISAVSFAAFALVSCNKEITQTQDPDAGTKAITVTINGAGLTKATASGEDPYAAKAHTFEHIDLYFTDASNVIKYGRRVDPDDTNNEWTNLTNTGVRYIGLEGVSRVYIVANSPETGAAGAGTNINELSFALSDQPANMEQNENVIYIGGDTALTVGSEIDNTVTDDRNPDGSEYTDEDEPAVGTQYYRADISIRPIISRLEISKISVITKGEKTFTGKDLGLSGDDAERQFKVEWEGFNPVLGGIYMSNFHQSWYPFNQSNETNNDFVTPSGQPIEAGLWDKTGFSLNITDAHNAQGVTLFSNYNTNAYENLFGTPTSGDKTIYFSTTAEDITSNPNTGKVVPFNFLVNYDITQTTEDINAMNELNPAFHFQFIFDNQSGYSWSIKETTSGSEGELSDTDPAYNALSVKFIMPVTEDNIYYANVTGFTETEGGTAVPVKPAKIYKMSEVEIAPFNITTGTKHTEDYNVIVKVTVIDFDQINVNPVFDKN